MNGPMVKGWCPGAYRPMMAADGLVVRIRPRFARLTAVQALGLCELAQHYGHGYLDLTNRANLQIRGVAHKDYAALLQALGDLGLLDADPALEGRRNIVVTPFWESGDDVQDLTQALLAALPDLPELPAKVGFAVDCCGQPVLTQGSADIRIEQGANGLVLRANGAVAGRSVTQDTAIPALIEMAEWLAARISPDRRRMAQVVAAAALPASWCDTAILPAALPPKIGAVREGALIGAAFGHVDAAALMQVIKGQNLSALRVTPWRMLLLEGGALPDVSAFITDPHDPLMRVDACTGAPFCPSASVPTRDLARKLAAKTKGSLHVSGCAKGCARARSADLTLVGNQGRFDVVRHGTADATPTIFGLSPQDIETGEYKFT